MGTLRGRTAWPVACEREESGDSLKTSNSREKPPVELYAGQRITEVRHCFPDCLYWLTRSAKREIYVG